MFSVCITYIYFKYPVFNEQKCLRVNLSKLNKVKTNCVVSVIFLRKEVIQPHLPIRLPCYDFTPIIYPTLGGWLQKGYLTDFGCYKLSWCDGRCVQGPGTYSPRRADPRLLATPASRRRVAASDPNWGRLCGIRSPSRGGNPLYRPL